ncbi:MAG: DUF4124 domain-containing protein [Burkholderiaceae bacterium]|nr:DUF4124 domain-containing protein [Burkholderiaceae bacterium]
MKTILLLLLALSVTSAQAQIYKWTDANGTVHYSDQPQDGQKATALSTPAAPTLPSPSQDNWRERERQSRVNRQRQELAERRAEAAQQAERQSQQPYNADRHRSDKPMTEAELCQRDRQKIEFAEKTRQMTRTRGVNTVLLTEAERQELVRERKADHAIAWPGG